MAQLGTGCSGDSDFPFGVHEWSLSCKAGLTGELGESVEMKTQQ